MALSRLGCSGSTVGWIRRFPCEKLLVRAAEKRVEAALVQVENFDEALRDLVRLINGIDTTILDSFAAERRRWVVPRIQGAVAVGQWYASTHCQ